MDATHARLHNYRSRNIDTILNKKKGASYIGLGGVVRFEAGETAEVWNPALQLAAEAVCQPSRREDVRQANMRHEKAPVQVKGWDEPVEAGGGLEWML